MIFITTVNMTKKKSVYKIIIIIFILLSNQL